MTLQRRFVQVLLTTVIRHCADAVHQQIHGTNNQKSNLSALASHQVNVATRVILPPEGRSSKLRGQAMKDSGQSSGLSSTDATVPSPSTTTYKHKIPSITLSNDGVGIVFFTITVLALLYLVLLFIYEVLHFAGQNHQDKTFSDFLVHRFGSWFTTHWYASALVLSSLTLALTCIGALWYWVLLGKYPWRLLFTMFIWVSTADIGSETTLRGRTVAILVAVGGLVIFGLLLGIISDSFMRLMESLGKRPIVEAGHVLILGYTESTPSLIAELAMSQEDTGGVIVLLDPRPRDDIDTLLEREDVDLKDSTLLVRSGELNEACDLAKVAADAAGVIVVLADPKLPREEADAKTVNIILTLTSKGWPCNGAKIVVQCCSVSNEKLMFGLHDNVQVVMVNDLITQIMLRGSDQPGLGSIYSGLLSFDGEEVYASECPDLEGKSFGSVMYYFEEAIPIGVVSEQRCMMNPDRSYKLCPNDKVVVIAEDAKYSTRSGPYCQKLKYLENDKFEPLTLPSARTSARRDSPHNRCLITGWSDRIGGLLVGLDNALEYNAVVDIYSSRSIEFREQAVHNVQRRRDKFKNIVVKHIFVPSRNMSALQEISKLPLHEYDHVFVLADAEIADAELDPDMKNVAMLACMQRILSLQKKDTSSIPFNPVVEVATNRTAPMLEALGLHNHFNVHQMTAQVLAMTSANPETSNFLQALVAASGSHHLEFCSLQDFLEPKETMPSTLSFADLAVRAHRYTDRLLIGWTQENVGWEMNPKDKTTLRQWAAGDRMIFICENSGRVLTRLGSTVSVGHL